MTDTNLIDDESTAINDEVIKGNNKLKLSITRMKKIRSNIHSGVSGDDHAGSTPFDKKPWG